MADALEDNLSLNGTASEIPASDLSKKDELTSLIARATAAYAIKDYSPAAELYSEATELQAEINGEMAIENADLLYSYGKCLYFVAVNNSDVLGGTATGAKIGSSGAEKKVTKKRKLNGEPSKPGATGSSNDSATKGPVEEDITGPEELAATPKRGATDVIPESVLKSTPTKAQSELQDVDPNKPYFQFTGDDETWNNSDEEGEEEDTAPDDDAAEGGEEEEEDDDFANAYEVLDLSRILLLRKLDHVQQSALETSDKGKYVASIDLTPEVREIKDRISDVHDLQAEISLEGERFSNAVDDLKAALALKEELYPVESSVLAECHYKLSLALEFSAVRQPQPQTADENGNGKATEAEAEVEVDEAVRAEAAEQMERAIRSCKQRVEKEQKELTESTDEAAKNEKAKRNIDDVKEMVADMEQRLVELRKPPVSVKEAEAATDAQNNALSGILGQILGGENSKEEQKKLLEEAAKGATDLSGLVKRKKPRVSAGATGSGAANGDGGASARMTPESSAGAANGKRKVEFVDVVEEIGTGKKARVEDMDDAE